jgi:site-specific recombinase XerD
MKRTAVTPTIVALQPSFARHLRAANLRPKTEATYGYAIRDLTRFLEGAGMPQEVALITREHVEAYLEDLLARRRPATALAYFKGLQQFWKWAEEEGEVPRFPHGPDAASAGARESPTRSDRGRRQSPPRCLVRPGV